MSEDNIKNQQVFSQFNIVETFDDSDKISLARNASDGVLYIQKKLDIYNKEVYTYLRKHPIRHMPRIYQVAEKAGKLVVIEQYIRGKTLHKKIEEKGKLSEVLALDYFRQLCLIIKELHSCNPVIIHRDIKPENIMVTDNDVVYLLDMNAAKFLNENESRDTFLLGTYGYAAPEQYGFGKAGMVSDIYGLGMVFRTMLTGSVENVYHGKYQEIIKRCTEIDPDNRYQSVDELLRDLNRKVVDYNKLPGFRTDSKEQKIMALIGYAFVILIFMRLEFEGVTDISDIWFHRFLYFAVVMSIYLFHMNYKHIWDRFGISKIRDWKTRMIVLIITDFGLLMVLILSLEFLGNILKGAGGLLNE